MRDPTTPLFAAIALFAAMPGRADYAVVNLPACITNSGTQSFTCGRYSATDDLAAFLAQFNDLTLAPGEAFDFTYVSLAIHSDAPLGATQTESRIMGIAFPDGTTHVTGFLGPCCNTQPDPMRLTHIVVDSDSYATPLNRVGVAYSGYHGVPPFPGRNARIAYLSYSGYGFATRQLSPRTDAIRLTVLAVPELQTWIQFGQGVLGVLAVTRGSSSRAGRDLQDPDALTHNTFYGAHTHTGAYQ